MNIYKVIDDRFKFSYGFFNAKNDDLDYVSHVLDLLQKS